MIWVRKRGGKNELSNEERGENSVGESRPANSINTLRFLNWRLKMYVSLWTGTLKKKNNNFFLKWGKYWRMSEWRIYNSLVPLLATAIGGLQEVNGKHYWLSVHPLQSKEGRAQNSHLAAPCNEVLQTRLPCTELNSLRLVYTDSTDV